MVYLQSSSNMKDIAQATLLSKLKGDINSSYLYLDKYFGELHYENESLVDKNSERINNRFEIVDKIKQELGDVATIFVKKGDDFERISTNILKEDNSRAIGTLLGKDSKAYNDLKNKKLYIGETEIIGKKYVAAYKPIIDSNDEVIGVLFIGVQKSEINETIEHFLIGMRRDTIGIR